MQKIVQETLCDVTKGNLPAHHEDDVAATETFTYSLDGDVYEIDVCGEHASLMNDLFSLWVQSSRSVKPTKPARVNSSNRTPDADKIRAWALEQGLEVSARGRLSSSVVSAYRAGH